MFFDGWFDLLRIVVVGVLGYAGLIIMLRVTGKRTLSKMNAFDLVVTVSLGSTLASAVLSADVSLSEALLAFAVLGGLQYVIAFASIRSSRIRSLVAADPALLAWQGRLLHDTMRRERVSEEDIATALRASGKVSLHQAQAVILETDGSFSVIDPPQGTPGALDALSDVSGVPGVQAPHATRR